MSDRKRLFLIFLLALLGFIDAGWLSVQSLVVEARALCGPIGNCADVLTSRYAKIFGIPVAAFGAAMYLLLMVLTYRAGSGNGRVPGSVRLISLTGMLLSAALMAILAFVLNAFCLFCVLSALTITFIWILSRSSASPGEEPPSERRSPWNAVAAAGVGALYLVFIGALWAGRPTAPVVARIGDEVLTEDTMLRELLVFTAETERSLQEMKIAWANNALVNRLLEREAAKRGMTVNELAEKTAGNDVVVSDSELTAMGRLLAGEGVELTAADSGQLRAIVIQQRREQRIVQLVDSLKKIYKAELLLEPIPVVNPMLDFSGSPVIGRPDARVMIVVFTDFQCPFCATTAGILEELRRRYPSDVSVLIKNLPLDIHPHAALAAEASLCALEQGKYIQLHDLLFKNQHDLTSSSIRKLAAEAGLDTAKLEACLKAGSHRQYIERDINEAKRNGVTGTPILFLNGRPLMGEISLDRMMQEVQVALR